MKKITIEETKLCPFHNCKPTCKKVVYREEVNRTYLDINERVVKYHLPELVAHITSCSKCKEEVEKLKKFVDDELISKSEFTKQASGFLQLSNGVTRPTQNASTKAWNTMVENLLLKIFKKTVSGKDSSSVDKLASV